MKVEEYVLHKKMEAILSRVQKPARYVGGEWGSVMKDKRTSICDLRSVFRIPMRLHVSPRFAYPVRSAQRSEGHLVRTRLRAWIDMEAEMREAGLPL